MRPTWRAPCRKWGRARQYHPRRKPVQSCGPFIKVLPTAVSAASQPALCSATDRRRRNSSAISGPAGALDHEQTSALSFPNRHAARARRKTASGSSIPFCPTLRARGTRFPQLGMPDLPLAIGPNRTRRPALLLIQRKNSGGSHEWYRYRLPPETQVHSVAPS